MDDYECFNVPVILRELSMMMTKKLLDFYDVDAATLLNFVRTRRVSIGVVALHRINRVHDDLCESSSDVTASQSPWIHAHDVLAHLREGFQIARQNQHIRRAFERQRITVTRVQARRNIWRIQRVRVRLANDVSGESTETFLRCVPLRNFPRTQVF